MTKHITYRKVVKPVNSFVYESTAIQPLTLQDVTHQLNSKPFWRNNLPLSVGFVNDLIAHYKGRISFGTHQLRRLVEAHCRTDKYISNIVEGHARHTLSGITTSRVTKEHDIKAKARLTKKAEGINK